MSLENTPRDSDTTELRLDISLGDFEKEFSPMDKDLTLEVQSFLDSFGDLDEREWNDRIDKFILYECSPEPFQSMLKREILSISDEIDKIIRALPSGDAWSVISHCHFPPRSHMSLEFLDEIEDITRVSSYLKPNLSVPELEKNIGSTCQL